VRFIYIHVLVVCGLKNWVDEEKGWEINHTLGMREREEKKGR